jgi:hypothetical protein
MSYVNEMEVFMKNLKDYMNKNSINIKNLSDMLDMSYSSVHAWFGGTRKSLPRIESALKICKCCHLDFMQMIEYIKPESTGLRKEDDECLYLYKTFPEKERNTVNTVIHQIDELNIKAEKNKSKRRTAASNVTPMKDTKSTDATKKSASSSSQYGKQVADKPKPSDKDYGSEAPTNPGIS